MLKQRIKALSLPSNVSYVDKCLANFLTVEFLYELSDQPITCSVANSHYKGSSL